jgi:hypothetical protein
MLVALWLAGHAVSVRADLIRIGSLDVTLNPNDTASYVVRLFNDTTGGNQSDAANRLFGWNLSLLVVPQQGSSGTVTIGTPAYPAGPLIPLANVSPSNAPTALAFGGYPTAAPGNYLYTSATDGGVASYSVSHTGSPIMQFPLVSTGASGSFLLVAVNNDASNTETYYTDGTGTDRTFTNSFSSQPAYSLGTATTLGTITIVPEPGSPVMVLLAGSVIATLFIRRSPS